jgi:homogentisate 1,2-dioxygenase
MTACHLDHPHAVLALAGGCSLHLCMTPHGPDAKTFEMAVDAESSGPQRVQESTLAFMFEVNATPRISAAALEWPCLDQGYHLCWKGLRSHFAGTNGASERALPFCAIAAMETSPV